MGENGIIQQYAAHLERKASGLVMRWTLGLGFVGAVLGSFPLAHISHGLVPSHLGYATLLLGAIAGAYLGYTTGERKAIEPRMQAQLALHQLQVEQSLIRTVGLPVPTQAVAPQPVPVAPPVAAPVAPTVAPPVAPPTVQVPAPAPLPPQIRVAAPAPVAPPVVAPDRAFAPAPLAPQQAAPQQVAPVPAEPAPAPVADLPRLVEPPQAPPLSQPIGF